MASIEEAILEIEAEIKGIKIIITGRKVGLKKVIGIVEIVISIILPLELNVKTVGKEDD